MKKSVAKKSTKLSRYYDTKSFTWFIPAPSGRSQGHREKEFDKILHGILRSGHEVIEWQTQAVSGEQGGLYLVFLLGSTSKASMGPMLDIQDDFRLSDLPPHADIELLDD